MTYGERIRAIRKEKGMTQKQVADRCGMADSAIRKYESGRQNPKLDTLKKIADALEVSIDVLLDIKPLPSQDITDHNGENIILDESLQNFIAFNDFIAGIGYIVTTNDTDYTGTDLIIYDARENCARFIKTSDIERLQSNIIAYTKFQISNLLPELKEVSQKYLAECFPNVSHTSKDTSEK